KGRPLSLEDALALAIPASETLDLAKEAIDRARGEHYQAHSGYWPQISARLGYSRLLRSQFEGFSFGGGDSVGTGNTSQLPFGQRNTYNLGRNLAWPLFTAGRG